MPAIPLPVRKSFRLKLILSYIFVIVISFAFIAFFLDRNLEEQSLGNIRSALIAQADVIAAGIPAIGPGDQNVSARLDALAKNLSPKAKCRITIIGNDGTVIADSEKSRDDTLHMDNHLGRPEIRLALATGLGIDTRYSPTLKIDMLYVARALKNNGSAPAVLRLALPLESVQRTLSAIRMLVLAGFFFALILAIVLGTFVATHTIKPINRMIDISRKFTEGDFSRRIIQCPEDEIGELANALNTMAQGIEDNIRQIHTQSQKLEAVFNSMIEGIIVINKAGQVISVNASIEKIFNVAAKTVEGKPFLEAIRNNDMAAVIDNVLKNGVSVSGEIALVYPVRGIFRINAAPIFDGGITSGCLIVIHDVTEMRRLETVRRDFVANVSHELKTPLTSIKGFVETLLEGALEDKENSRSFLKIIEDHTERLSNLVNDLLSLAHLESKEIVLDKEDVILHGLAEKVILGFTVQLKKRNISVKNELPEYLTIKADRHRLEQVFTNLIDNAIKFNREKGSVVIRLCDEKDRVKICVQDTGPGIPQKDIPRIFERFYRVDKARSRELGGTGLGLSIVKHIVESHGGVTGVETTEGRGSNFWFTLPK